MRRHPGCERTGAGRLVHAALALRRRPPRVGDSGSRMGREPRRTLVAAAPSAPRRLGSVWCFGYRAYRPDVEHPAALLHQMVLEAARVSRAPITLVGHGFGGLVLRYHARRYPPSGIRRIVTLGTPHQGTDLARWHPMLRRHLTPGAALLNRLNANDRVPQQFDVIAISSTFDARILPAANAEYPEAFNVKVADVGHNALLFSKKIVHLICENLDVPAVAGSVAPRTGLAPKISP